jgi:hypothetical protein
MTGTPEAAIVLVGSIVVVVAPNVIDVSDEGELVVVEIIWWLPPPHPEIATALTIPATPNTRLLILSIIHQAVRSGKGLGPGPTIRHPCSVGH